MTGRERVVAAYKGGYADRVPAYPIAGSFAGCLDGLSIEEYCTNPKKATQGDDQLLRALPARHHGGVQRPRQGGGGRRLPREVLGLRRSLDRPSTSCRTTRAGSRAWRFPIRSGPAACPAFLEQCEALSAARLPSGLGAVLVGPWTIAMLMRNPELMCLDTIDDPAFVHELMRFATEYAKRFGDAVLATKIGLSYSDPTASCSLVGPDTYREFIKPYHKELVDYFRAKKVGTTIHICGTTHQIHEDLVDVGLRRDHDRPRPAGRSRAARSTSSTSWSRSATSEAWSRSATWTSRSSSGRAEAEIEAEVRRCIDTVGKRSRFVLSTSCELPPRANPDCVKWIMDAAREYGRYDRILASAVMRLRARGSTVGQTTTRHACAAPLVWAPSGACVRAASRERVPLPRPCSPEP